MTDPDRNEVLRARLPRPRHRLALTSLLEGLALWAGAPLSAVASAGDLEAPSCAEDPWGITVALGASPLVELPTRLPSRGRSRSLPPGPRTRRPNVDRVAETAPPVPDVQSARGPPRRDRLLVLVGRGDRRTSDGGPRPGLRLDRRRAALPRCPGRRLVPLRGSGPRLRGPLLRPAGGPGGRPPPRPGREAPGPRGGASPAPGHPGAGRGVDPATGRVRGSPRDHGPCGSAPARGRRGGAGPGGDGIGPRRGDRVVRARSPGPRHLRPVPRGLPRRRDPPRARCRPGPRRAARGLGGPPRSLQLPQVPGRGRHGRGRFPPVRGGGGARRLHAAPRTRWDARPPRSAVRGRIPRHHRLPRLRLLAESARQHPRRDLPPVARAGPPERAPARGHQRHRQPDPVPDPRPAASGPLGGGLHPRRHRRSPDRVRPRPRGLRGRPGRRPREGLVPDRHLSRRGPGR